MPRFDAYVATATFGVYLIHDNGIIRTWLWIEVFQNAQYQDSILLIPYSILVVIGVYFVCTIIDLVRQKVVEKPSMALVNRYANCWIKPFERICDFMKSIVFGIS